MTAGTPTCHADVLQEHVLLLIKKKKKWQKMIKVVLSNKLKDCAWEFPGGPVVRTPCFHCRGHGFDPWSGNQDPASRGAWLEKN